MFVERQGLVEPLQLERAYAHRNVAGVGQHQSQPELAKKSAIWPARTGSNGQSSRFPLLADPALSASGSLGISAFGFDGYTDWTGSARAGSNTASRDNADNEDDEDEDDDDNDDEKSNDYRKRDMGTVIAAAAPQAPPPSIALTTGGQPVVVPAPGEAPKSFTNSSHSSSTSKPGMPAASGTGAARAPALQLVPSPITKVTTIVSTITSETLVPAYSAARAPEPLPGAGIPLNLSPLGNLAPKAATITIAEIGDGHSISLVAAPSAARAPAAVVPAAVPAPAAPKASPYVPPAAAAAPAPASPKAVPPAAASPAHANSNPKPAVIPAVIPADIPVAPKPAPVLGNSTQMPYTNGTKSNPGNTKPGAHSTGKGSMTGTAPKASNGGNTRATSVPVVPAVAAAPAVPDCNCACRCPAGSFLMGNVAVAPMQAKPSSSSAMQGAAKPRASTLTTRTSSSSSVAQTHVSVKVASHSGNVRAGASSHSSTTTAKSSSSTSSFSSSSSTSISTTTTPSATTHVDMALADVVSTVMAASLMTSATTTSSPHLTVGGSIVSLQSAVIESLVGGKVIASALLQAEGH